MSLRRFAVLVILIGLQACDNVGWGGAYVRLEAPPDPALLRDSLAAPDSVAAPVDSGPALPEGPVLFAGYRSGRSATLVPVAEVRGGMLVPLPDEAAAPGFREAFRDRLLGAGTRFTLFAQGVRVGTLVAERAGEDASYCPSRPAVEGALELVPGAEDAERFLALSEDRAAGIPYAAYRTLSHSRDQRVASLNVMSRLIPRLGAQWPPSVLGIRRDIRVLALDEDGEPAIVASFVYRDDLTVGEAPSSAYSVFFLATPGPSGYEAAYVAYRPVGRDGKGAARYFEHFDWDRDGHPEMLLEVAGARHRWFRAIEQTPEGRWVDLYQDPCGIPGRAD